MILFPLQHVFDAQRKAPVLNAKHKMGCSDEEKKAADEPRADLCLISR